MQDSNYHAVHSSVTVPAPVCRVREDLTALETEPEPSGAGADADGYAARKQQRDNDEQLHTNQPVRHWSRPPPPLADAARSQGTGRRITPRVVCALKPQLSS